jgi:parallel beta-helix repeat protein
VFVLVIGAQSVYSDDSVEVVVDTSPVLAPIETVTVAEDSYIPHAPIFIDDDGDFAVFPGEGTEEIPYLIENLEIVSDLAHPIHIQDTTAHFEIRNCILNGLQFTSAGDIHGIFLNRTINGRVVDSTIINCIFGVYLLESDTNTIEGNSVSNCYYGVYLEGSCFNTLAYNTATSNSRGFRISGYSDYNNLTGNIASDCARGFRIQQASDCVFIDNIATNHRHDGFYFDGSNENNFLINNTATDNSGTGIILASCRTNTLINNSANSNGLGFYLVGVRDSILTNNNASYNSEHGFELSGCWSNDLVNNSAISNDQSGFWLRGLCHSNNLTGNTADLNYDGFHLQSSSNNVLVFNNATENTNIGYYLWSASDNNLTRNNSTSYGYGLCFDGSDYNTLSGNTVENCQWGMYLEFSSFNLIFHNILTNNILQALDIFSEFGNFWYHPDLLEGNYWSDYQGLDDGSGTGKHAIAGDGIGDTDLPHPSEGYDLYPLVFDIIIDSDGDLMPNDWELANGLDPYDASDATHDPDGDFLVNIDEYYTGTNPQSWDSDMDLMPDGWEVVNNLDPLFDDGSLDNDFDGLRNLEEFQLGTSPWNIDSDSDGWSDGDEVFDLNTDPSLFGPIFIDENADFDFMNFPGNGDVDDPYILEGFVFAFSNLEIIHIQDTTVHFEIRLCELDGMSSSSIAIYMFNVINGRILNNSIRNCDSGIYVGSSSMITVSRNTISSCEVGVHLYYVESGEISFNVLENCDTAILVEESPNVNVFGNWEHIGSVWHVPEPTGVPELDYIFIQNALDWMMAGETIKLEAGDYFVHRSLFKEGFSGTLKGAGKGVTNVVATTASNGDLFPTMYFEEWDDFRYYGKTWDKFYATSLVYFSGCEDSVVVSDLTLVAETNGIADYSYLIDETSGERFDFDEARWGANLGYAFMLTVTSGCDTTFEQVSVIGANDGTHWQGINPNHGVFVHGCLLSEVDDGGTHIVIDCDFVGLGSNAYEHYQMKNAQVIVESSTFKDGGIGIIIWDGYNLDVTITDSFFENQLVWGVVLDGANGYTVDILHNTMIECSGIRVFASHEVELYSSYEKCIFNFKHNDISPYSYDPYFGKGFSISKGYGISDDWADLVISNNSIQFCHSGVEVFDIQNGNFSINLIKNCTLGFNINYRSDQNLFSMNSISNCTNGFYVYYSRQNLFSGNNISNCYCGFNLTSSYFSTINGLEGKCKMIGHDGEGYGVYLHSSYDIVVQDYFVLGFDTGILINGSHYGSTTIKINRISDNRIALKLVDSKYVIITRNIISDNELGISVDATCSSNHIYLNHIIDNTVQIEETTTNNFWYNVTLSLGNFWGDYSGKDKDGDGVGDRRLPHQDVDWYPLVDLSIPMRYGPLPIGDDWWQTGTFLVWRGGWSSIEISVTDSQGRVINSVVNDFGLNAWYYEETQSDGTKYVVIIIVAPPFNPHPTQLYSFEMTALVDLTYWMEWFVSYGDAEQGIGGEVLFERSVEEVPLESGQTRLVETSLEFTPEGEIVVEAVAQYDFGGILQPINTDGTSVFEQGSTIPVKFQLFDENGNPDGTAFAFLELAMVIDGVVGDFMPADSTSTANIANVFRYDEEDAQYIFNLNTTELDVGIYILRITLDDGQQFMVQIEIT